MRIYTRQGDAGTTRLFGGETVSKDHERVEAYGTLDELNSHIGVARTVTEDTWIDGVLEKVQNLLFELGGELAAPSSDTATVTDADVAEMEATIDTATDASPELRVFILPGGTPCAAHLHVARTVCRRSERRLVALSQVVEVRPTALAFVNRLSDLLFALARMANARAGIDDVRWNPRSEE